MASERVKVRLALEKIVSKENIEVNDEEVENEYKAIVDAYGVDLDTVKNAIAVGDIKKDLAVRKAYDLVRDNAVITDAAPVEEVANETEDKKETEEDK